ncbi:MAG: hypothetical protein ACQES1_11450 [Bacteroidota bacterium]
MGKGDKKPVKEKYSEIPTVNAGRKNRIKRINRQILQITNNFPEIP